MARRPDRPVPELGPDAEPARDAVVTAKQEIKAQLQDADKSNTAEFSVRTVDLEDQETAMQPEVARQAAEISGGRQLSLAGLGDFPGTLPEETLIANTVKIERELWDTPLWFILIAVLAGAEWFLRRKDNLV